MNPNIVKFISIYWLYLSVYFLKELPLDNFQVLNDHKMDEHKRMYKLISKILKHTSKNLYELQRKKEKHLFQTKKQRYPQKYD